MPSPTPEDIKELFAVHRGEVATNERLARSFGFDETRRWVDPNGRRLSDRVWLARQETRRHIDDILRRAIATGEDALLTARKLEQFLAPRLSPLHDLVGRLVRGQRPRVVTRAPGRGGMGSFSARRLARTEISRAHGQATIWAAERNPFVVGVRWLLSARHAEPDACDQNATRDVGLGPGVSPPADVPRYPNHPHDLCTLAPAPVEDTDAVVRQLRALYDLDAA